MNDKTPQESVSEKLRIPRDARVPTLSRPETFDSYAEAYYQAAKSLWESIPKSHLGVPRPDTLVIPVLFLIHHFLELEIKEVIDLTFRVGSKTNLENLKCVRFTHDLTELLSDMDHNLSIAAPNKSSPLSVDSMTLIQDVQNFGAKGEHLRFPYDRDRHIVFPETYIVDMSAVLRRLKIVWEEFGGPIGYFSEYLDFLENEE